MSTTILKDRKDNVFVLYKDQIVKSDLFIPVLYSLP